MKVINLKTEYLVNPLGIDITRPTICWNIVGDDIKFQKAFELFYKVDGGQEQKVSLETSSTRYQFEKEFKSRNLVTWKVRILNEENKWSDYSEEQFFSIGLLN